MSYFLWHKTMFCPCTAFNYAPFSDNFTSLSTSTSLTTFVRRKRDDADDFLCGFGTTLNDAAIGATIGKLEYFLIN